MKKIITALPNGSVVATLATTITLAITLTASLFTASAAAIYQDEPSQYEDDDESSEVDWSYDEEMDLEKRDILSMLWQRKDRSDNKYDHKKQRKNHGWSGWGRDDENETEPGWTEGWSNDWKKADWHKDWSEGWDSDWADDSEGDDSGSMNHWKKKHKHFYSIAHHKFHKKWNKKWKKRWLKWKKKHHYYPEHPTPVPLSGASIFFISGLGVMFGLARRRKA